MDGANLHSASEEALMADAGLPWTRRGGEGTLDHFVVPALEVAGYSHGKCIGSLIGRSAYYESPLRGPTPLSTIRLEPNCSMNFGVNMQTITYIFGSIFVLSGEFQNLSFTSTTLF
jgi:hypothetical protein